MASHALRFLVVVVKIAPRVTRSRESVKKISRSAMSAKASYQVFYKVMCSIAIQIQRNSASSFFFFSINEELRSVVNEDFNEKLSSQILDTECVEGKRVLMHGSILPVTIPPGHTPGDSHLAVYSPPSGTQKETIPHPRDSSSTKNTLFCVQNIDYDIDFRTVAKADVFKRT